MKKFVSIAMLIFPIFAAAQTAASAVPEDAGSIMSGIVTAFAGRQWPVLIGFVLAGAIFVVRNFVLAKWVWAQTSRGGAILALAVGVIGVVAAELIAGRASLGSIIDGVLASWVASGMFSQAKAAATPTAPKV